MKTLFIGGTGTISSACASLAVESGMDLTLVIRGSNLNEVPPGCRVVQCDVSSSPDKPPALQGEDFDCVVDWIAFTPPHIQRDIAWFRGHTGQFIFISSASVLKKPPPSPRVDEQSPVGNPYWPYEQNKIDCEVLLRQTWQQGGFPFTIVRPSLTYNHKLIPLCVNSWAHSWTAMDRMLRGLPVVVPGDGTSLWTLTHSTDFAKGFVPLLGNPATIGETVHITSDEVLSWNQIYSQAGQALGVEPKLVPIPSNLIAAYDAKELGSLIGDKSASLIFDTSKLKRLVPGYVSTIRWQEGVQRAVDWFREDPRRQTIDVEANENWERLLKAYERAWPDNQVIPCG